MTDIAQAPIGDTTIGYGKVIAALASTTVTGAVTTVICSIINGLDPGYQISTQLQGAIQTLVGLLLVGIAVWATPHCRG